MDNVENNSKKQKINNENIKIKCPYLDTINKQYLDFDFEKVCSISMKNQNIYACLVCGKYFQGRGKNTHAYIHSVQQNHHVYIHLDTDKIYCLPDNYQVMDHSLQGIKNALRPTFTDSIVSTIDQNRNLAQDAFGVSYLPGFVGLNNLTKTDYVAVVVQALAHVPKLRDYFLMEKEKESSDKVVQLFGQLIRKLWSKENIKNTVRHIS